MENQDKIYEQFKKASDTIESEEFPSMEKVWSRVEEKLDKKVLTKQSNLWKKIAIAASVLLLFTLTYQIFKPDPQLAIPKKEVAIDPVKAPEAEKQNPIVIAPTPNPVIRKEAPEILKQQLEQPQVATIQENAIKESLPVEAEADDNPDTDVLLKSKKMTPQSPRQGRFQKGWAFDAVGVQHKDEVAAPAVSESDKKMETKIIGNPEAPLVVIDGKPITGKDAEKINTIADGVAKADPNGDKDVVVLKEPLYIINGHYYSEADLFGPNPTSPYAPLNQQEIETILVLQGEKAIANYGKKGEKGVVVITTKGRKPASRGAAEQNATKTSKEKAK